MIDQILSRKEFQDKPPVLIDVGASGEIHAKWKKIAKYSICIAFDADEREMSFTENKESGFEKLITINRIVTDRAEDEIDFYLTQSPFLFQHARARFRKAFCLAIPKAISSTEEGQAKGRKIA